MPITLFIVLEGLKIPKRTKARNQASDSYTKMGCRTFSATNGNWLPLDRNDVQRLLNQVPGYQIVSRILLMLLASCITVTAQNTASLTIQGTMPSIQRLNISPVQAITATDQNQIVVALDAKSNTDAGYAVTIQSKQTSAGQNGDGVAYQLKCDGHPVTMVSGAATLISKSAGDRPVKSILKISNPSPMSGPTFALTIISQ